MDNTAATSLSILSCNVSYEEAKAIAEILKENHTLTSIKLNDNNIGYKGAKAIREALKENHTLTSINLRGNRMDYKGTKAIAEADGVIASPSPCCPCFGFFDTNSIEDLIKVDLK